MPLCTDCGNLEARFLDQESGLCYHCTRYKFNYLNLSVLGLFNYDKKHKIFSRVNLANPNADVYFIVIIGLGSMLDTHAAIKVRDEPAYLPCDIGSWAHYRLFDVQSIHGGVFGGWVNNSNGINERFRPRAQKIEAAIKEYCNNIPC